MNFAGVDTMEKGALIGMMSLALSDLLFCVVTVLGTNTPAAKMIYRKRNFVFYYTLYANWIQNTLIKISTWFTVILGGGRSFAVSYPITARKYLKCKHTVGAILTCSVLWVILKCPMAYTWTVQELNCTRGTIYILHSGPFIEKVVIRLTFICIWFSIGFVIPLLALAFCNFKLILSLRHSEKLRLLGSSFRIQSTGRKRRQVQRSASDSSHWSFTSQKSLSERSTRSSTTSHNINRFNQKRITYTLLAIVILFFVCVFPSEVVQFYAEIKRPEYKGFFKFMIHFVNLLQAINFSANFVLYCLVNSYFRKTLRQGVLFICRKCFRYKLDDDTDSPLRSEWSSRSSRVSTKSSTCI